jgi:Heterokaryon incompatibility protein (HET)
MLRALLDQRQSPDEGVWIDACCIEQSNETEKIHAVGSVDIVYKSARLVVIILEDVYLPYEDVDTIREFTAKGQDRDCHKAEPSTISRAFARVATSRWFSRAWCSHEFQLGANSLFLVPTERGLIQLTMRNLMDLVITLSHDFTESDVWNNLQLRAFMSLTECYLFKNIKEFRRSPMAQFAGIIDLHASLETDKISIASNVAGLQLYFSGPKKSEHQCRWILIMLALSAGDLTSLCGKHTAIPPSAEANRLPWLRWNTASENRIASLSPPSFSKLSKIALIKPDHIILDLYILKHCSFRRPSTDSILNATKFVDRYSRYQRLKQEEGSPITDEALGKRILQIEKLACSLDCGLAWLTENIIFNQDMANEMRRIIKNCKLDLWPMIADLLIDAYPLEKPALSNFPEERKQSASLYIYFVMDNLSTEDWKDDSGELNLYEDYWAWLDSGTLCGKALVLSLCGKFTECHFAVPAALAGPTCATMDRLWLLRPRGDAADSEWTIVEKTQFTTFRPLEADGENIIYRAKQTIRG